MAEDTKLENKKYELTDEKIRIGNNVLYRIKALMSFGDIEEGDLGGYIAGEANLSFVEGDEAWVYGRAFVYENATVTGNAKVTGYAKVHGNAIIRGNAVVGGSAEVSG